MSVALVNVSAQSQPLTQSVFRDGTASLDSTCPWCRDYIFANEDRLFLCGGELVCETCADFFARPVSEFEAEGDWGGELSLVPALIPFLTPLFTITPPFRTYALDRSDLFTHG